LLVVDFVAQSSRAAVVIGFCLVNVVIYDVSQVDNLSVGAGGEVESQLKGTLRSDELLNSKGGKKF
jgi:hypothetical protein